MFAENRQVLIKSNKPIENDDYDLFVMFLENRKQSGGGDIETIEPVEPYDRSHFKILYESPDSKQGILSNSHLKFKSYELKAFDPSSLTLALIIKKNENYALNEAELIISNLLADDDFTIVEMYAENLLPDNEVQEVRKIELIQNTYFVKYKQKIDRNVLIKRHEKKPKIRDQAINILDSFDTKTLVIQSDFRDRILDDLKNFEKKIEMNERYLLLQSEDREKLDAIVEFLRGLNYALKFEYLYNFDLLNAISNKNNLKPKVPVKEIAVQSEILADYEIEKPHQTKKETKKAAQKESRENIVVEEKKGQFDRLIKFHNQIEIVLNQYEPMSVGLLNSKQLVLNLNERLSSFNSKVSIGESDIVSIKLKNFHLKNDILNALSKFHKFEFLQQTICVPEQVLQNEKLNASFKDNLSMIMRKFIAVFVELKETLNRIELYGPTNAVLKVSKKILSLVKKTVTTSSDINLIQGSKPTIKPQKQIIKPEKVHKEESEEEKDINDAFKAESTHSDIVDIYFSTSQTTTNIPSIDELSHLQLYHIDPKTYDLLELCLLNCEKIKEDFIDDMREICPDCELIAFKEDKVSETVHFAIDITNAYMNEALKKNNLQKFLTQLMDDYDRIRTNLIRIGLSSFFSKIEETFSRLCANLLSRKLLDDLVKKIKLLYNSESVVRASVHKKKFVEIYGYKKAVEIFEDYVRNKISKTKHVLSKIIKDKLSFKLSIKKDPRLKIFFKFNDLYFNSFDQQLKQKLLAKALKLDDKQHTIQILSQSEELKSIAQQKIERLDLVYSWRQKCDEFVESYLSGFAHETLEMPFKMTDPKSSLIEYDSNKLEAVWLGESLLELNGVKSEVEAFKNKLSQISQS